MKRFSVNLAGRIRNFALPKSQPLIPLYEAIINSFHAIEDRRVADEGVDRGEVVITVLRDKQMQLDLETSELAPVTGFTIKDNGIGFNGPNMESFLMSDSCFKQHRGGKGVGRFSWLKAFDSVSVCSAFFENGQLYKRQFRFSLGADSINDAVCSCEDWAEPGAVITLESYKPEFAESVPKQSETIAMKVIQHCLIYFLDPKCPTVKMEDQSGSILLNKLFAERFRQESKTQTFGIDDHEFKLLNLRIDDRSFGGNRLYLCANNRLVDNRDLEKIIPDLDRQLYDQNGFWYIGVLESTYLDDNVDMNRLSFTIPENGKGLFGTIPLEKVVRESSVCVKEYLAEFLKPIRDQKMERIRQYVSEEAPQFRHLIDHEPDKIAAIKPMLDGDKLDDALHEIKRDFDKESKKEQRELLEHLKKGGISLDDYKERFQKQMKKINDANRAALADYMTHRKIIIDLMEVGLQKEGGSEYALEKYMHNLIYPMRAISDEVDYSSHNLWLIDEKLSYCRYISSDVPFGDDPKQERVDLLILDHPVAVSEESNVGAIFNSIVIFELKRPMRDDYTSGDNPITQLYDYVQKIRNGKALDKNRRPINVGASTQFYLYAVCDITKNLQRLIEQHSFTPTPDRMGYYKFNDVFNAYFEILSYDKILSDAKKRNRVLFDKLGM